MIALTRAFGWHRPDETPCGQPVPIAEAHAMLELSRCPGLTQQELGSAINLRKSTVSRLVGKLERRGWVNRVRSSNDRRAVQVSLTEAGDEAAQRMATARAKKMDRILEAIPEGDRPAVLAALASLVQAARAESNAGST